MNFIRLLLCLGDDARATCGAGYERVTYAQYLPQILERQQTMQKLAELTEPEAGASPWRVDGIARTI
jgi:hypothetical protein